MLRTLRNHTKVIMIIVILFFVASCFAGYGLYVRGGGEGEGMRDYPVAEIDGREVMRSALEQGAARLSEQYGAANITSADIPLIRKAVIDNMAGWTAIRRARSSSPTCSAAASPRSR